MVEQSGLLWVLVITCIARDWVIVIPLRSREHNIYSIPILLYRESILHNTFIFDTSRKSTLCGLYRWDWPLLSPSHRRSPIYYIICYIDYSLQYSSTPSPPSTILREPCYDTAHHIIPPQYMLVINILLYPL